LKVCPIIGQAHLGESRWRIRQPPTDSSAHSGDWNRLRRAAYSFASLGEFSHRDVRVDRDTFGTTGPTQHPSLQISVATINLRKSLTVKNFLGNKAQLGKTPLFFV
jgi:hypothetical protein